MLAVLPVVAGAGAFARGVARGCARVRERAQRRQTRVFLRRDLRPRERHKRVRGPQERPWAYNDACSLSGYYGLLRKLDEMGEAPRFFGEVLHSGSHLDSIRMVADHEADAATIDSSVLWMRLKERPELAELVRVIDSWGPFPVQPVVVRSGLDPTLKGALRDAFLDLDVYAVLARAEFGFRRLAPVTDEDYAPERLLPNASEKPAPL